MKTLVKIAILGSATVFAAGCQTNHHRLDQNPPPQPDRLSIALEEASGNAVQALRQMAETNNAVAQQAMTPEQERMAARNATAVPMGMDIPMTINWAGPLEPLVEAVAERAGYEVKVVGKAPTPPVMVEVNHENDKVADIVRNISAQIGQKATLNIYSTARLVEVKYAAR